MELAARLRREARATNERRLLVLAGSPGRSREWAADAIGAANLNPSEVSYLGPEPPLDCEQVAAKRSHELLGTTREAIIVDCHERCEPNALGRAVGAIDGGGLFVLLTPPLDVWPETRNSFDASLAIPPFEPDAVSGEFRERLVETLRAHRGIAIVDVDSGTIERDGQISQAPRRSAQPVDVPIDAAFPPTAYEACLTRDQRDTLEAFELLRTPGRALVVEADRGRGKSSVAGLAAASLAREGKDVLVTAPRYRSVRELFARAEELLSTLDELAVQDRSDTPQHLETPTGGCIRFERPPVAAELSAETDRVFVDEAAALPVQLLASLLDAEGLAFMTTVHGYEGAGRGFSVRFREYLDDSPFDVTDVHLGEPIRYAAGDPIEVWSFRALALDARPPVDQLVAEATPESVNYRQLSTSDLRTDEQLLSAVFGLLVLAHYRTEPNDFARLLDAPNISVHALCVGNWPVSVALLAREGGLDAQTCWQTYRGGSIRGNLIPDLLASQLRDEGAPTAVGQRVLRIATHHAVRSRGLGSLLLDRVRDRCDEDWLGVSFGATPRLIRFWARNGFSTIHLGTSRDERSGEHSAVMLDALSELGETLRSRHSTWFRQRLPGILADSLSELDPDVVRAVCRATRGRTEPDLSLFEWRIAAGMPYGAAIHSTAPRAVRQLTLAHLFDSDSAALTERQERLLVMRALQCRPTEIVTAECSYPSPSACMRALGQAVEPLVERYGDADVQAELERLR